MRQPSGAAAKRFFRIEPDGERALRSAQETMRKMMAGLESDWRTA